MLLNVALIILAVGFWATLWGGRLWRGHRWRVWCELATIVCLVIGFALALIAPKGEGNGRAVYFEPDAAE